MSESIQYLICCHTKNEAVTHQLMADNWFRERFIDFAVCKICGANLIQKRYIHVNGEYVNTIKRGASEKKRNKIWAEYQELLESEIQTYDNDYLRVVKQSASLMKNVHYMDKGIEFRTNHTRTGRKWAGDKWLNKVAGRYK